MGQILILGLIAGGISALFAVGVVLVYRGTGVLTFAGGEIGAVSLYTAALLVEHSVPYAVAAVVAVAVAAVLGLLFEVLVVRAMREADPVTVSVATVGLTFFLLSSEFLIFGNTPRELANPFHASVTLFGVVVRGHQVIAVLLALGLGFGLQAVLRRTDFGLGILAAAQDPAAVRLVGVPLSQISLVLWGGGAALAGMAALLVEPTVGVITPGYASELYVSGLAAAVIGGLTSLPGAVIGGVVLGIAQAIASRLAQGHIIPGLSYLVSLGLVLVVLLARSMAPELRKRFSPPTAPTGSTPAATSLVTS